jgi:hypothetical protein
MEPGPSSRGARSLSSGGRHESARRSVRDQAALHGLLMRVCDLGVTLLAVVRVEPEAS